MVIAQKSTQSLAAPHGPLALPIRRPREQQDVTLPLTIPLALLRPAACGLVQYANEVQRRDLVSLDIALAITAAAGDQASSRAWASRIDCNDVTF